MSDPTHHNAAHPPAGGDHSGHPGGPDPAVVATGHETADATARSILVFAVSMTVTLLVVVGMTAVMFAAFRWYENKSEAVEYAPSPLAGLRDVPPSPPLQPSPPHQLLDYEDMASMRDQYNVLEHSAGSQQMSDGKVHNRIEVAAAIELIAQRGLPRDTATHIPAPQGTEPSGPTEYGNGGRGSPLARRPPRASRRR